MKKLFRAASEEIVEALILHELEPDQPGWFKTREEAFAAFSKDQDEIKRKPGRPKKDK